MKNYISISKVIGKEKTMIRILKCDNKRILNEVSKIEGSLYHLDSGSQYIPYTKTAFGALKRICPHVIIHKPGTSESTNSEANMTSIALQKRVSDVSSDTSRKQTTSIHVHKHEREIEFNDMSFYIKIPYNNSDVKFLKTLRKNYWSTAYKKWICKASIANLEALQARFNFYNVDVYKRLIDTLSRIEKPYQVELYYMPQSRTTLCVKISGHNVNLAIVKAITNRQYDTKYSRWLVPNDQRIINYIIEKYVADGAVIKNSLWKKGKTYSKSPNHLRKWIDNIVRKVSVSRAQIITEYTDSLISKGYMPTTVKQYTSVMLKYMDCLESKDLKESNVKDYERYISSLYKLDLSDSLVNTYNSALKYCFKYVILNEQIVASNFKRPKKRKKFMTVRKLTQSEKTDNQFRF